MIMQVARRLAGTRHRVSQRLGHKTPSTAELVLALRAEMSAEDALRAKQASHAELQTGAPEPHVNEVEVKLQNQVSVDIEDLVTLLHLSNAVYEDCTKRRDESTSQHGYNVSAGRTTADVFSPSWFLAHNQETNTLVVSVRGTYGWDDVVTVFSSESEALLRTRAHSGVVWSAQTLLLELEDELKQWADSVGKPRQVVFTGHSLGGSVACVLSMMLRERYASGVLSQSRCVAFCPVAFLADKEFAESLDYCTAVVHGVDLIPRFTFASFERFVYRLAKNASLQESTVMSPMEKVLLNSIENAVQFMASSSVFNGSDDDKNEKNNLNKSENDKNTNNANKQDTRAYKMKNTPHRRRTQPHLCHHHNRKQKTEPEELYIGGSTVLHVEREFLQGGRVRGGVRIVPKRISDFTEIEASQYMANDHFLLELLESLTIVAGRDGRETSGESSSTSTA